MAFFRRTAIVAVVCFVSAAVSREVAAAAAQLKQKKTPAVSSTVVSEALERIFAMGSNFGDPALGDPPPLLQIGETPTGVDSFTPNPIVAFLPLAMEAGTYRLVISGSSSLGSVGLSPTVGRDMSGGSTRLVLTGEARR